MKTSALFTVHSILYTNGRPGAGKELFKALECCFASPIARLCPKTEDKPQGRREVNRRVHGGCGCSGSHLQRHLVHRPAIAHVAVLVELRWQHPLRGAASINNVHP